MTGQPTEPMFPSTTVAWKWHKLSCPPEAIGHSERKALTTRRLARAELRKPLPMTLRARGGAEEWFQIESRGQIWRFPGYIALLDAALVIKRIPW